MATDNLITQGETKILALTLSGLTIDGFSDIKAGIRLRGASADAYVWSAGDIETSGQTVFLTLAASATSELECGAYQCGVWVDMGSGFQAARPYDFLVVEGLGA